METIEQVNENFNVKKPKKKGLIIGLIVVLAIILVLLFFPSVFTKPEAIFNKAIDKIFAIEADEHTAMKFNSKINVSIDADTEYAEVFEQLEKCNFNLGVQLDTEEKKEIVDLGLEYDNEPVIDFQGYYNDGELYAYLDEIFDKYIQVDLDNETKEQLYEIFENIQSNNKQTKEYKNAVKALRNELKKQIKEEGTFEREKETIDIGDKEQKVTKTTLILSYEQLYNVLSNTLINLSENEEFLDVLPYESSENNFKNTVEELKKVNLDSIPDGDLRISIYTKGLLNKFVGVNFETYVEEENMTVGINILKENEGLYTYVLNGNGQGVNADILTGKVEIQKEKDSKNEQQGKLIITLETSEMIGNVKAEFDMDYNVEYDKGIDEIDVKNSIKMEDITENDIQSIMEKLMKRPLIGDLIEELLNTSNDAFENSTTYDYPINDLMFDNPEYVTSVPNL